MSHILIAEDEEFLRKALKDNLESEGFHVATAANGEEALSEIHKKKPDLLLLDLLMPKRDGFSVLEDVRGNPELKLMPIVVLSNLGGDNDIKRALEMGASDYFVKSQHPIEEVVEKVHSYIEGGSSQRSHVRGGSAKLSVVDESESLAKGKKAHKPHTQSHESHGVKGHSGK